MMNGQNKPQGQGFWKEHFETWKVSGLTQQAYCTREGISYQSFVYQHNRTNSKLKKPPVHFVEAKIKSVMGSRSPSGLQVILPNGVRIGIDGEFTTLLFLLDMAYHNMAFFEQIFWILRLLLARKKSELRRGMFYC